MSDEFRTRGKLISILIIICVMLLGMCSSHAQIKTDKKLHFVAGTIAGSAGYTYAWQKTKNKKTAFLVGIGTSILAGTIKEIADSTEKNNRFDKNDLASTVLGGVTISVTIDLFNKKK